MYTPEAFQLSDRAACFDTIEANSFGELVTVDRAGVPMVTHLPFLLDRTRAVLLSHLAKANPQLESLTGAAQVLVVFHGCHTYVSPAWYETRPAVPTWNYVAVHVYGRPRLLQTPGEVQDSLRRLVEHYERSVGGTWSTDLLGEDYFSEMAARIQLFEVPLDRLEGKAKLSQNRSPADRASVVAALEKLNNAMGIEVAKAMRSHSPEIKSPAP